MADRTLFIVNPAAGAGRGRTRWVHFARTLPLTAPEAMFTANPGEAATVARETAVKYQRVIAVGGDGTISDVAHGILSSGAGHCALGVIPVGTGNDIARMIGIDNLEDARRALGGDHIRLLDTIEINCHSVGKSLRRSVLLFAGVGIVSQVLRNTTPFTKRILGRAWAYRAALLRAVWQYESPRMRITSDGKLAEGQHLFLGISNAEDAGGGMRIAPGAQMDDGWLDINLVGAMKRWEALKQLRRLNLGRHTTYPAVRYFRAREVRVESDSPIEVAADGELIGHTPARFVVRPKTLSVVIPD